MSASTSTTDDDGVVTSAYAHHLLSELRTARDARITAEARELDVLHRLCVEYDTVDEDAFGEAAERLMRPGRAGTPPVAEFLSLEVSALLGVSPASGANLIGQVLDCFYRHPMLWAAVQSGRVRWYLATDVISHVNAAQLSQEQAQWVDQRITPLLQTLPRGRAIAKLKGLVALANPETARDRERQARASRHVAIWTSMIEAGGTCLLGGRLDVHDGFTLDTTLRRLADILASQGDESPVDIRRATALGILADPSRALSLLTEGVDPGSAHPTTTVVLHLTDRSLADASLVGRVPSHGPLSRETWIDLVGHDKFTIRPVVDLNNLTPADAYEIPDKIRRAVSLRSPVDMFPYGTRAAAGCDLDHTIPYDHSRGRPPGQTRIDNLAPLSRKAHRAKTARCWRVTQDENGWLEWTSPAGYRYAVGPHGTLPLDEAS